MCDESKLREVLIGGIDERDHVLVEYNPTLAARSWPDLNAYAEAKTEVIERIIAAARDE